MKGRVPVLILAGISFLLLLLGAERAPGAAAETNAPANAGWRELGGSATGGGISDNDGDSSAPALAVMADGAPVIAWSDDSSGNREIYVRRWDGDSWTPMGADAATGVGISDNEGQSAQPAIAAGPSGELFVAWYDGTSGGNEIYVRRWNGTSWEEVGGGSATGGGISDTGFARYPALVIAPDGAPIVAWEDAQNGDSEIYIRRLDGEAWVELGSGSATGGGISDNAGLSGSPALALDAAGNPIVAWQDDSDGDMEIYVRRWNGASWEELGGSATGGGISDNDSLSGTPSVAVMADGAPVVAWDDVSILGSQIFLRRWNGKAWEEMGDGSASTFGISQGYGGNIAWAAITPDGLPAAAWHSYEDGNFEIYARRWMGEGWMEMGQGAASGGGLSGTVADSFAPRLAFRSSGEAIVAWQEDAGGDNEIYVRVFPACHALTLSSNVEAKPLLAAPGNSPGCPANRYVPGELISLNAARDEGMRVKQWFGTDDDNSTAYSNTATMPNRAHTAGVVYESPSADTPTPTITPTATDIPPTATPTITPSPTDQTSPTTEASPSATPTGSPPPTETPDATQTPPTPTATATGTRPAAVAHCYLPLLIR